MPYRHETRYEIWKIIEMKDGCVYRTKSLGLVWVPLDEVTGDKSYEEILIYKNKIAKEHGGDFLGSVSMKLPYEEHQRSVKVS